MHHRLRGVPTDGRQHQLGPAAVPSRSATNRAGIDGAPAQRHHDPDALRPGGSGRRRPSPRPPPRRRRNPRPRPAGPEPSGRGARAGRPARSSASGGTVTWPTPTTTGVRGSRAMDAERTGSRPKEARERSVDLASMRVAVGSDHAGFALKEVLKAELTERGHEVDRPGHGQRRGIGRLPRLRRGGRAGRGGGPGRAGRLHLRDGHRHRHGGQQDPRRPGGRGPRRHDGHAGPPAQPCQRHLPGRPRRSARAVALDALAAFLSATEQHGRHDGRIAKLADLDRRASASTT